MLAGEVPEKLAAAGADPAPAASLDEFRDAYVREIAAWEKLVQTMKVEV